MKNLLWMGLLLPFLLLAACDKDNSFDEDEDPAPADPVYIIEGIKYSVEDGDGMTKLTEYNTFLNYSNLTSHFLEASFTTEVKLYRTSKFSPEYPYWYMNIITEEDKVFDIPRSIRDGEIYMAYDPKPFNTDIDTVRVNPLSYGSDMSTESKTHLYIYATIEVERIEVTFEAQLRDTLSGNPAVVKGKWVGRHPVLKEITRRETPITEDFNESRGNMYPAYAYWN